MGEEKPIHTLKKKKKRPKLISLLYYSKPYEGYCKLLPDAYKSKNNWRLSQEHTPTSLPYIPTLEYTLYAQQKQNKIRTRRAKYDSKSITIGFKLKIRNSINPHPGRRRGYSRFGFLRCRKRRIRQPRWRSYQTLENKIK